MKLQCEICGGELLMDKPGEGAVCKNCGVSFSVDFLKNKLNNTVDNSVKNPIADFFSFKTEAAPVKKSGYNTYEELHEMIAGYFKHSMLREYEIEENVSPERFGAHPAAMKINFLFKKNGTPVLAVAILKSNRRQHGAVTSTIEAVSHCGIEYVDFFYGMPNEEHYVMGEVISALGF